MVDWEDVSCRIFLVDTPFAITNFMSRIYNNT